MIRFYSKSADKLPGMGTKEVRAGDPGTLPKDFRKILSNFHLVPLKYDGHEFNCPEAMYHYLKYRINFCTKGVFSIVSNPNLTPEAYKKLGRAEKLTTITEKQLEFIQDEIVKLRFRQDPVFSSIVTKLLLAGYILAHTVPRTDRVIIFAKPSDLETLMKV